MQFKTDEDFSSYMKAAARIPLLSREETAELAARAHNGDIVARNKIVKANLRYVVVVAKDYKKHHPFCPVSLSELVYEGNTGLIQAADGFNSSHGCAFITYARTCIYREIKRFVQDAYSEIHIPENRIGTVKFSFVSLETPASEDSTDSFTIGDTLADNRTRGVLSQETYTALQAGLHKALENIPEREARIVTMREGLGSRDPLTLSAVGDVLDLTRERVRQLEKHAHNLLREMAPLRELYEG